MGERPSQHEQEPIIQNSAEAPEEQEADPFMRELSVDEPPEHMKDDADKRDEWGDVVLNLKTLLYRKPYAEEAKERKLMLEEALAGQREAAGDPTQLAQETTVIDAQINIINEIYDEVLEADRKILDLENQAKEILDKLKDSPWKTKLTDEMEKLVALYESTMETAESGDISAASRVDGILTSISNIYKEVYKNRNIPNLQKEQKDEGPTLGMGMGMRIKENYDGDTYFQELSVSEPPEHMADKEDLRKKWEDAIQKIEAMLLTKQHSDYADEQKYLLQEALAGQRESRALEMEADVNHYSGTIDEIVSDILSHTIND